MIKSLVPRIDRGSDYSPWWSSEADVSLYKCSSSGGENTGIYPRGSGSCKLSFGTASRSDVVHANVFTRLAAKSREAQRLFLAMHTSG